jgi:hypothetical protein
LEEAIVKAQTNLTEVSNKYQRLAEVQEGTAQNRPDDTPQCVYLLKSERLSLAIGNSHVNRVDHICEPIPNFTTLKKRLQ